MRKSLSSDPSSFPSQFLLIFAYDIPGQLHTRKYGIHIVERCTTYVWKLRIFSFFFSPLENVGNTSMTQKVQLTEQQHLKTGLMCLF